jgi:hypothetical protein
MRRTARKEFKRSSKEREKCREEGSMRNRTTSLFTLCGTDIDIARIIREDKPIHG